MSISDEITAEIDRQIIADLLHACDSAANKQKRKRTHQKKCKKGKLRNRKS